MRVTINLRFAADVESEAEAWDIAEGLERAAMKRDYVGISAWVDPLEGQRSSVLVPEGQAPVPSAAERIERVSGLTPTAAGDVSGPLSPVPPGTTPD